MRASRANKGPGAWFTRTGREFHAIATFYSQLDAPAAIFANTPGLFGDTGDLASSQMKRVHAFFNFGAFGDLEGKVKWIAQWQIIWILLLEITIVWKSNRNLYHLLFSTRRSSPPKYSRGHAFFAIAITLSNLAL